MLKVIGEILSLVGALTEIYERGVKTYKKSIKVGILRYCVQLLAYLFLGGINGAVVTLMAIVRYLLMYKKKFSNKAMTIWLAVSAALNLYFASGIADLFPFLATVQFTLMVKKQNTLSLKYAQIVNTLIWSVYHIAHRLYVYLLFDFILAIIGIIRVRKGVED